MANKTKNLLHWMNTRLDNVKYSNDEIAANCPFCESIKGSPDTKRHFSANESKAVAHCFRCDWSGTWLSLVMQVDGCSYTEAIRLLNGVPSLENYPSYIQALNSLEGGQATQENNQGVLPSKERIQVLKDTSGIIGKRAVAYLRNRQIPDELIFSGLFGIIPGEFRVYIFSSDNYWQGRAIANMIEPKYKNPPIEIGGTLGLYDSSIMKDYFDGNESLCVCEGVFSALAVIRRFRLPALCLYGKTARPSQFERLVSIQRKLYIMLDADAKKNAWELALQLHDVRDDIGIVLLKEGDPEDCHYFEGMDATLENYLRWRLQNE